MQADKIPDEIMREAYGLYAGAQRRYNVTDIARALMARDTAARKECAEIARAHDDGGVLGIAAEDIRIAIEATIGGRDEQQ